MITRAPVSVKSIHAWVAFAGSACVNNNNDDGMVTQNGRSTISRTPKKKKTHKIVQNVQRKVFSVISRFWCFQNATNNCFLSCETRMLGGIVWRLASPTAGCRTCRSREKMYKSVFVWENCFSTQNGMKHPEMPPPPSKNGRENKSCLQLPEVSRNYVGGGCATDRPRDA